MIPCYSCTFIEPARFAVPYASPSLQQRDDVDICPQSPALYPKRHADLLRSIDSASNSSEFRTWAQQNLQGAIRIPTETFDDLGPPGQDPRWESRLKFHEYLSGRFPFVRANLNRTVVNHYALVYHWQGSDELLKPMLLTAHQDTVPVDTNSIDQWVNPPFSGELDDDEWIWGRGSSDCKSVVIGLLTAVESLLKHGFAPARSIVLAFGMDEESGGAYGGPAVRDYLLRSYGKDGFFMLVDEGTQFAERNGTVYAQPGIAEKGMMTVQMNVTTPGGHSAVPPRHTSIAFLSLLLAELDSQPLPPHLYRNSSHFQSLECSAQHDPEISSHLRSLIMDARRSDASLSVLQEELLHTDPLFQTIVSTTQAVTVIRGGIKFNALPTEALATIDHRIADWSSMADLKSHYISLISPLASKLGLTFDAFGESIVSTSKVVNRSPQGHLQVVQVNGAGREPSPVSPTLGSAPWEILSGTILATLKSSLEGNYNDMNMIAQPTFIGVGNTDTGHYWDLTKNIYRYAHLQEGHSQGEHGINEAIRTGAYLEIVRFLIRLILNADETADYVEDKNAMTPAQKSARGGVHR
ncbi:hypothetical protein HGRIS_006064 [Hohenbuehelia grisea]|uniref:Peptidase M20 dimerisation domain-containing protein n=1 Tax=Hohenbuehelia grisea TaxID=104357 RepID=A0ABR3JZ78_9AGAR